MYIGGEHLLKYPSSCRLEVLKRKIQKKENII
jgi:hypothetical protein